MPSPAELGAALAAVSVLSAVFLYGLFRSIRHGNAVAEAVRSSNDPNAGIHTLASVQRRTAAAIGPAAARLYGLIGDVLDSGRWRKASDSLLDALRENPDVLADVLVEWNYLRRLEEDGNVYYEETSNDGA